MNNLPLQIEYFIKNSNVSEINIGCSDTRVLKIEKNNHEVYYLKIGALPLLTKEYASLIWLKGKLNVPQCIMFINDGEREYLLTKAVAGEMSCSDYYLTSPETTVKLLAKAINTLQQVDIKDCPFRNDINYKLGIAEYNVTNNLLTEPMKSKIGERFSSYADLLSYLKSNKPKEELTFSHGDTSMPNIFFENNTLSGFIDVGECGVADKWFDIAIACKSIKRNFPDRDDLVELFLNELGVKYSEAIDYYEAIMDLYL